MIGCRREEVGLTSTHAREACPAARDAPGRYTCGRLPIPKAKEPQPGHNHLLIRALSNGGGEKLPSQKLRLGLAVHHNPCRNPFGKQ